MTDAHRLRHPDDSEDFKPWPADAEPVEVAPGVYLPSRLRDLPPTSDELDAIARETDTPKMVLSFTLETHMELRDYVYVITRLVMQAYGDEAISGKSLRGVAVTDLMEDPVRHSARVRREDGMLARYEMHDLRRAAQAGPTDENLISAARVYAVGHAMQIRPTAAVEDALGLKRSTAENWVRRAKDKGYVFAEA